MLASPFKIRILILSESWGKNVIGSASQDKYADFKWAVRTQQFRPLHLYYVFFVSPPGCYSLSIMFFSPGVSFLIFAYLFTFLSSRSPRCPLGFYKSDYFCIIFSF
jgi:hypothetical protein